MTQNSTATSDASLAGDSYLDSRWAQKRDQEVAGLIEQLRERLERLSGFMARVPELEARVDGVSNLGLQIDTAHERVKALEDRVQEQVATGRGEMDLHRQALQQERDAMLTLWRGLVDGDIQQATQVLEDLGQIVRELQNGAETSEAHLQGWQRLQAEMHESRPETEQLLTDLRTLQAEILASMSQFRVTRVETTGWLEGERAAIAHWIGKERDAFGDRVQASRTEHAQDRAAIAAQVEAGRERLEQAQQTAAQLVADAGAEASRILASARAEASEVLQAAQREAEGMRQAVQTETSQTLAAVQEERQLMRAERTRYQEELSKVLKAAADTQIEAVHRQGQEFSAQVGSLSRRLSNFTEWFREANILERLRQAPPQDSKQT